MKNTSIYMIIKIVFSISLIPLTTFDDLHSIEWLKLYNNELTTLHYELMEPVLDTLKHIDIHSKRDFFNFILKFSSLLN